MYMKNKNSKLGYIGNDLYRNRKEKANIYNKN